MDRMTDAGTMQEEVIKKERLQEKIGLAQKDDKEALESLVEDNLGLVWSIVHRYMNRGYEVEDLFQIGSIGLIKAIKRFDLSFDVKFSTYAVPMISGEIRRFLRDDGMVKVSRSIKENRWKIEQAKQTLQGQYVGDVTVSELAEITGLSTEDVLLAMDAPMEVESLNKPLGIMDGKETCLEERICGDMDEKEQIDNRLLLEQLLNTLNETERQLICLRYFQDCTQSMVAKRLHMSQVQVSRMEKKLLKLMREQMLS